MKRVKISVKDCLNDRILVDLFTKLLKGNNFKLFRRTITGLYDVVTLWVDSYDKENVSSTSNERVEDIGSIVDVDDKK